jgi:hypothetical protein
LGLKLSCLRTADVAGDGSITGSQISATRYTPSCINMEEDALELRIKLDYALRSLEEKSGLLEALRANVQALAEENQRLEGQVATLNEVQNELLNKKHAIEQAADTALREKAELASEAARLHVFSRECAQRAEQATRHARELRAEAEARSKVDAALISEGIDDGVPGEEASPALKAQLTASRLLVTRLLGLTERAGIAIRLKDLLHIPQTGDSSATTSSSAPPLQPLERELLVAALSRLGYTDLQDAAKKVGMTQGAAALSSSLVHQSTAQHVSSNGVPSGSSFREDKNDSPLPITAANNTRKNGGARLLEDHEPDASGGLSSSDLSTVGIDGASGAGAKGSSMLSPLTRPFVALGESFWTTLVGEDASSTPGGAGSRPNSSLGQGSGFATGSADGTSSSASPTPAATTLFTPVEPSPEPAVKR